MKNPGQIMALLGIFVCSMTEFAGAIDEMPDNLNEWTKRGVVLRHGERGAWDENPNDINILDVYKVDGTYYMFYYAGKISCWMDGQGCGYSCVGLATSPDGVNFTKHPKNPVIRPDMAVYVSSWEHGIRAASVTYAGNKWVAYAGVDHSGNKTPGMAPQETWPCDVGVDADVFAFTSTNGFDWQMVGEVGGVLGEGEMYIGSLKYHRGTFYAWLYQAEPNMCQAASKGTDYMNLQWQGWIDELKYGWSNAEPFIHNDNETVTLIYWPFGASAHPGTGKNVYFATSSLSNMTDVRDRRVVGDNVGWEMIRHSMVKDVDAGEWRWYYGDFSGKPRTICLRTAPLKGHDPDNTPPSAPSNLSASAAGESQIDLSWDAASDPESGISSYAVYRNGTKVGTSGSTSYSDKDLAEGTTYTYRVSAINGAGKEGEKSNEVSAATEAENDTSPPEVAAAIAQSATSVKVSFNEPVTKESAENTGHYSISGGITVGGASLQGDNTSVVLTTSTLTEKTSYTLTVSDITDQSPNANTGGGQVDFMLSGEIQISNLSVASGKAYEIVEAIAEGDKQFVDRDFTWESLGDCAGMAFIRTANDDKMESGESFLSFDINTGATIYVAYRHGSDLPPWLSSWSTTGNQVCGDGCSDVYKKDFGAGTVTLGGNKPGGAGNMYTVFVDAGGAPTIFMSNAQPAAVLPADVRLHSVGDNLSVSGLDTRQAYTITLTDASGRITLMRKATDSRGMVSLSTAIRSRGVYVVTIVGGNERHSLIAAVP